MEKLENKGIEVKAKYDVYVSYLWRKGFGRRYELYKYTSNKEITDLGKNETCFLLYKKGDMLPNIPHNRLEWKAAVKGSFTKTVY